MADEDKRARVALTVLDAVLGELIVCTRSKAEDGATLGLPRQSVGCGCPVVGAFRPDGEEKLVALDPDACESWLDELPPVEAAFWRKRIRLKELPPDLVELLRTLLGV